MKQYGFTIVEILIGLAILGIISAITFASFSGLNSANALHASVGLVASNIEQARSLTLASHQGEQYGVHLGTTSITMFTGAHYGASDADNVTIDIDRHVEISNVTLSGGGSDILFQRLTGATHQSGTITLSLKDDSSSTKIITIDATGIIE